MNYYVDIHANILPNLPSGGGEPLQESEIAERLEAFRKNNIKQAIATPLYQPECFSPDEFLSLRDEKIAAIKEKAESFRIIGGALIPASLCMKGLKEPRKFALGQSDYILITLPQKEHMKEFFFALSKLRIMSGLCPIIADVDQYYDHWTPEDWIALRQEKILLQISVDGLLLPQKRKLSLYLLANQYAHFVATGAHSLQEPLHFIEAMRIMQRSLPANLYRRIKNNSGMMLSNAEFSAFL